MKRNIRDATITNLDHTQNVNRNLVEKALQMRCEGYLAQAKTILLTQTIFEINRGKKEVNRINIDLKVEKQIIQRQKLELEEANRLLEETNADLEAYAYTISHDLKTPIHAILGFSELLKMDCPASLDSDAKGYLDCIFEGAVNMSNQIDALLQLSRSTGGIFKCEKVDLSALAKEVVDELKTSNPERNVEILIQQDLVGDGDKHLLKSLLQNLLSNAWKYTGKTSTPHITFQKFCQEGGQTTFKIEDNGAGFDMSSADRLFQPFQRQHKKEEFEGTGVGLATVKRIVLRHHGKVWAESEVDKGTSIYFSLGRVSIV